MNKKEKIEIFEEAFHSGAGHSTFECNCGKVFYNSNGQWDWDDGELEELKKSNAIDLPYTVSTISFEGIEYSVDCDCWHQRSLKIFDFLVSHNWKIMDFYKILKKHKQTEVDDIIIDEEEDIEEKNQ